MNRSAFGAVSYDFSDPTVAGAQHNTAMADDYSGPAAKAYIKSALAGITIPYSQNKLAIQAAAIQKGFIADADVLAKVQADDPGGEWGATADMMSEDYYDTPTGNYTTQPGSGIDKYKNYVIAGSVLLGGLALIWYLRK